MGRLYHEGVSRLILLTLIGTLTLANAYLYHALFAPHVVIVESLSVGKGSALLVRMPGGGAVLVGAGADASIVRALGQALPPWQRRLDALVLPASTLDASGGAPFVIESYRVGTLLRSSEQGTPTREAALASAARAAHTRTQEIPPEAGLILHYGSLSLPLSASTTPGTYVLLN